jgi:hypothetical protein
MTKYVNAVVPHTGKVTPSTAEEQVMRIHAPICTINDAPDRTQPFKTLRGNQAGKLMIATRAYTHEKRKQLTWNKRIKKNGKT